MKMKKFGYVILSVVAMVIASGSFVSCKDYDEDVTAGLKVDAFETKTLLDDLNDKVMGAEGLVEQMGKLEAEFRDSIAKLQEADKNFENEYATVELLNKTKDKLEKVIKDGDMAVLKKLKELEKKIGEACACVDLTGRVQALETWKEIAGDSITNILPRDIKEAYDTAYKALLLAQRDSVVIEQVDGKVDSLRNDYNVAIDSINENISDLDAIVDQLLVQVDENTLNIDTLRMDLDTLSKQFNDSILVIRNELNTLKATVDTLVTKVDELTGRVDKVEDYLAKLISGILVQAVYNPIYGTFALPANINSNVLAAYYGDLSRATKFPTARPSYYANPEATLLTTKDLQMMGISEGTIKAGRIVTDAADNAGTVYVTVNPTNIDFTGQTLGLVNSLDEDSHVVLAPLAKSNKKLSFGWNRAASNGFYEAKARIEPADVESVKARVDLSAMKETFKDVLTPRNGVDVSNLVATVAGCFTDVLDANALKASWKNEIDGSDMALYSQYGIAATAVKPLSYSFLQDLDVEEIPGIGRAENLLNRLFDKVSVEFGNAWPTIDVSKYYNFLEFRELKLDTTMTVTGSTEIDVKAVVSATAHIPAGVYPGQEIEIWDRRDPANPVLIDKVTIYPSNADDVPVTGEALVKDTITFEVSIKEFIKDVNADFNEWIQLTEQDLCDNLNELLDELNQLNDVQNKVDNAIDNVQDLLIKFLDKFNDKATAMINSANKLLQPVMFVRANGDYARVSGVKSNPTLVNSTSITLIPTSYTADVVAPPYKRLVGVTNVYNASYSENAQEDGGTCLAELNRVNELPIVGEVVDGTKTGIAVNLQKGYVYEFAYTTVDYSGYVVAKKCYIAVK